MKQKELKGEREKLKGERRKVKVIGVAALLSFSFSLSTVSAQESINATGGNASGSGGSISYSVGQVAYPNYPYTSVAMLTPWHEVH